MLVLLTAGSSRAEETVRRQLIDAGIHIPVLTRAPTLITFIGAQYPAEAEHQGLSASVALTITIGSDGRVSDAQVTAPHTPVPFSPPLERAYVPGPARIEAAIRAVLQDAR